MTVAATPTPAPDDRDPHAPARSVHVRRRGGVLVATPVGSLDADTVDDLRRRLEATDAPVVVDLDDCIVIDPASVAEVAARAVAGPRSQELCIVTRRPTCRLLLARAGITARFAVFRHLEDALQARVLADAGYGTGWAPASLSA